MLNRKTTHVSENGTFEVWFWSPSSPNAERVFGQRAIRLKCAMNYYGQNFINHIVNYATGKNFPRGRHFRPIANHDGSMFLGLVMNDLDEHPYVIPPLTAEKIACTVCEIGFAEAVSQLERCRVAVYQPIFLQRRTNKHHDHQQYYDSMLEEFVC